MAYKPTFWLDRVVDSDSGEVIQNGTDMSAGNFNNMEDGISDAHLASRLLSIALSNIKESTISYGTADLSAGVSALETGKLYLVYE